MYLRGRPHARGLTRQQEVDLGRAIEQGDREVALALARSPVALFELGRLAADLQRGALASDDVLRSGTEAELSDPAKLAARLDHVAALSPSANGQSAIGQRNEIAEILVDLRLESTIVERLERVLRAAGEGATLAAVARGKAASNAARARLVEANVPRAFSVARRYFRNDHHLHDLVQEGVVGLMRAAEKFDYRRRFRFGTYATWWIEQAVERAVLEDVTIHVPQHVHESRRKVIRATRAMKQSQERPTADQIAERSGLTADAVRTVLNLVSQPVSLETPVGPDGELRLGDTVPDRDAVAVDEAVAKTHLARDVRALLGFVTPRELYVLRMRFGLDGGEQLTLDEIGRKLLLSRERVRQIEAHALGKLRRQSRHRHMDTYLA